MFKKLIFINTFILKYSAEKSSVLNYIISEENEIATSVAFMVQLHVGQHSGGGLTRSISRGEGGDKLLGVPIIGQPQRTGPEFQNSEGVVKNSAIDRF